MDGKYLHHTSQSKLLMETGDMVCAKHPSSEQNCTVCELEKEVLELQDTLSKVYGMLLTARAAYGDCDDFTVNYKINEAIVTIEEHKEG